MVCVQPAILSAMLCYRGLRAKGYLRLIIKTMVMKINRINPSLKINRAS
jgi:hypothetical protein